MSSEGLDRKLWGFPICQIFHEANPFYIIKLQLLSWTEVSTIAGEAEVLKSEVPNSVQNILQYMPLGELLLGLMKKHKT